MKKNLLWLVFILIASGAGIAAYEPIMKQINEKPVTKSISFTLYKGSSYSSKVYKQSSAEIYVTVEKVRNSTRTIVWDTIIEEKILHIYPPLKKAFSQEVIVPDLYEGKDNIELSYLLVYNSDGNILKLQSERYILGNKDSIAIRL